MISLFDAADRRSILERLERLTTDSPRQWGKMTAAQMMAHCTAALETATGDKPRKRQPIGYLFGGMVRKKLLGPEPFSHDSPTDPTFKIKDERDFAIEKRRLREVVERFVERGPEFVGTQTHSFLGRLSGDEWGRLMGKHLDHHLRQFAL